MSVAGVSGEAERSVGPPGNAHATITQPGGQHDRQVSAAVKEHSHLLVGDATNSAAYTYDDIGQLRTAKGTDTNNVLRLHEQFGYAYDAGGNLNYRTNNALVQTFAANSLNQLTNVSRSGTLTVSGSTSDPATNVTVNGVAATAIYSDNTFTRTNVPFITAYGATAKDIYGRTGSKTVFVTTPTSVTNVYDLNGNLIYDGLKSFEYDDENQLIRVTRTNSWKSEFTYDGKMRRRVRQEYVWSAGSSSWVLSNEVLYVYDGNLVVQERNSWNLPQVTYTRGKDLSGGLEGAGGIGGLLARTDHSALSPAHAYYFADGNGNVTMLINTQQIAAGKYQYDPFGNALALSGPLAEANLYRFSSKERHDNSGLGYYLYRYYAPEAQRWLNRDPIAERGGFNLYAYARNNPINWTDAFGLRWIPEPPPVITRVQCDGSGNLEINWNPRDKNAPWAACTEAHEKQHMEDLKDRFGENACAGVPEGELPFPGPDFQEFWRKSEYKANRDNLDCLKSHCPGPVGANDVADQKRANEIAIELWECEKHGL